MEKNLYQKQFQKQQKKLMEDLFSLLKFESISADPTKKKELIRCASFLKEKIQDLGFSCTLWNEKEAPILFAELKGAKKGPTLLIYNHYDVQPADPLEEWKTPPFSPCKKGTEIFARGAEDNKGQTWYTYCALKLLLEAKKRLPVNIKWIIEGQEESGSEILSKILPQKKKELKADYLLVVDSGMQKKDKAAITLGARGLITLDVEVEGTNQDLHSGGHGGLSFNPIHALVAIMAKLRDERGKIQVPHFYDKVIFPSKKELKTLSLSFDEKEYKKEFGTLPTGGEQEFSPSERVWLRPTIEMNGITGGYSGPGAKTVIPAKASCKLSCRLVPNQEPAKIGQLVKDFIEKNCPPGVTVKVTVGKGGGMPVRAKSDSALVTALRAACKEVFHSEPEFIFSGGSFPVIASLTEACQATTALFGLGLPGDQIHSPNEHFGWDRIEKGIYVMIRLFEELAETD